MPEIPPGEDEHSFSRHNNLIKAELKKANVNRAILNKLADLSFAIRRRDILQNGSSLDAIYSSYPFLKDTNQVYSECCITCCMV